MTLATGMIDGDELTLEGVVVRVRDTAEYGVDDTGNALLPLGTADRTDCWVMGV